MKKIGCLLLAIILGVVTGTALADGYTDKDTVMAVQQKLNEAGYDCGMPDGVSGKNTKAAIERYQQDSGMAVTGVIDDTLLTALGLAGAQGETVSPDTPSVSAGNAVSGTFDDPALDHPETRYSMYTEGESDGSEQVIYMMLDSANDEAEEIAEYGALYITEHQMLTATGTPTLNVRLSLQDSPYGKTLILEYKVLWKKTYVYMISHYTFVYDGENVSREEGYTEEAMRDYCENYHFPYGSLIALRGVRQDENGYTYFLVESDDPLYFEFVTGEGLRILQTRVYEKNEEGVLTLTQYADYDVGPAWEIPQTVLKAMGEVLSPVR